MSQAEIAKALGLSPATMTKMKRQGCPMGSIESVRAWRARNIGPYIKPGASTYNPPPPPPPARPPPPRTLVELLQAEPLADPVAVLEAVARDYVLTPKAAAPEASQDAAHITYIEAKRRQAVADMRHAETELQRQAGALVWLAEVADEYTRFLITARESFMQLPGRLVPLLVADPTPAAMDRLLHDAIAEVLRALAQHPMMPAAQSEGAP